MNKETILLETKMNNEQAANQYEVINPDSSLRKLSYPCDSQSIGNIAHVIQAISNITKKDTAMAGQAVIATLAGQLKSIIRLTILQMSVIDHCPYLP